MKKGLVLIMTVALMTMLVGIGFAAVFSDTETSVGNSFTAGTLDLTVDGQNDPISAKFTADNMKPGQFLEAGCVELKNDGSLPGKLSVKVSNLVSDENGLVEPELAAGDSAGVEVDPDGYHGNTGDGELWDMITVKFCIDAGAGSNGTNKRCDWDDIIIRGESSTQDDYSSYYSIPQNVDLAANKNVILLPGGSKTFCTAVKFIDDTTTYWWGGQGALKNNMAMSDVATFDIEFGLVQQ